MNKFHAIQVFIEVADCKGFASAARKLNMSPPSVTRAVSMLENELGTRLFVRTTRSLRLTEAGKRFLEDGRRILVDLEEAELAAMVRWLLPDLRMVGHSNPELVIAEKGKSQRRQRQRRQRHMK